MEKPNPPEIAALGAMTDTLDFVKKIWGNLGVPGLAVPTLSVDEINKKISDLKAVESWLSLNMNMLRGTIQALEVQGGTIAALQSISLAVGAPASEPAPPFESPFAAAAPKAPPDAPAQPVSPFEFPSWAAPASAGAPEPKSALPDFTAAPVNPGAWWNLLQEQFQQAVSKAVSNPPDVGQPATTAKPAAVRKRKPS